MSTPSPDARDTAQKNGSGGDLVYVIDGLLDLTLEGHPSPEFNLRMAAFECIKAYLYLHTEIRRHFLSRAVEGHKADRNETGNILTLLLNTLPNQVSSDPYATWFAALIMFHLLYNDPAAKATALSVTDGDIADGEEVVTSLQAIGSHLACGLARGDDPRVLVAYLMLLIGWLFDDRSSVDDFLSEGSHVQALIHSVMKYPGREDDIVQGLCAFLLGVIYEFSTKDSPVPRPTLQHILLTNMGRDKYLERLTRLRAHHLIRDFEITAQKLDGSITSKLPDVFFDSAFVELLKDNYSTISRAIDRDPDLETPTIGNSGERGVSRGLVDSLREQLLERDNALEDSRSALELLRSSLSLEKQSHEASRKAAAEDLTKLRNTDQRLRKEHEAALQYVGQILSADLHPILHR